VIIVICRRHIAAFLIPLPAIHNFEIPHCPMAIMAGAVERKKNSGG